MIRVPGTIDKVRLSLGQLVTIIGACITPALAFGGWAWQQSLQVQTITQQVERNAEEVKALRASANTLDRIDERTQSMQTRLTRLEARLDGHGG